MHKERFYSEFSLRVGLRNFAGSGGRQVIEKLSRFKGVVIQDGSNIPPGTPVENINAMMEAAERYGQYD